MEYLNGRSNGRGVTVPAADRGQSGDDDARDRGHQPSTPASSNEVPDPEVSPKAKRRKFTAVYKLRILQAADACVPGSGELGELLRREGLYSSHLSQWRAQRDRGVIRGLEPVKRGRKAKPENPLESKVAELERELDRTRKELKKAELIIDVQKKVSELLGISLQDGNGGTPS